MNSQLKYEIRKLSHIEPNKKYPALFLMHGIGSNEQDMLSLVDGLEDHFFIFSIRGHLSQPPGYAYFTIKGFGQPHREVFDEGINKLKCFIDDAVEQYPVDRNFLYLLGFSQGAIVSMTLGLSIGNKIKGIVALSGYIPDFVKEDYAIQPVDHVSLFISHGKFDNILPYDWGVESYKYFSNLGSHVAFNEYQQGHGISLENKQDFTNWLLEDLKK
ncbi:alpha/beta hydrolase [Salinibacillus xinjiangensis]|uniref:Esterase n=1 Tax=Salinibacillus xinjiangensis TaxID=1229268 RepID=A0A6G1X4S2_9BACI|nr:esterase [Salinibacillus xinjiangensis]MRG85942.1 esterase [Salinibacillus xinjiangensis]